MKGGNFRLPFFNLQSLIMQRPLFLFFAFIGLHLGANAQHSLQDYIYKAKENSPLLFDNKQQIQVNQLETERLKAVYTKPQISLSASYLFAPILSQDNGKTQFNANAYSADKYVGYDLAASNGGTYQGLINYNQPLFNASLLKAYSNQSLIQKQRNENAIKLTEHDIEKLITDQYLLCLLDKNQMLFADSMLKLIKEQISIVETLVNNSILKQSDLSLLNIEYQNNFGMYSTFKATYMRDLMDLNVLCGLEDTSYLLLDDINLELSQLSVNLTSNYLEKFKIDSLNILSTQLVFETKYKPQLNLYSNAGLNAVYAPTIANRFGMSAGLNFTWNLFDGNQKSIVQEKTDLQLQSIAFSKNYFTNQNSLRKTKILGELNSYDERKIIAESQLKEYDHLLLLYRKEIVQGQLSVLSYITTLKNMTTVKRDYFLLETNRQLLINAYNYWNW